MDVACFIHPEFNNAMMKLSKGSDLVDYSIVADSSLRLELRKTHRHHEPLKMA